jgi:hypothetical protein
VDIGLAELPDEFERDRALAMALEMRLPADIEALAEGTGLPAEVLRFFMQHPDEAEEFHRRFQQEQARQRARQMADEGPDEPASVSNQATTTSASDQERIDSDQPSEARGEVDASPVEHGTLAKAPATSSEQTGPGRESGPKSTAGERTPARADAPGDRLPVYVARDQNGEAEDPEKRAQNDAVEAAGVRRVIKFELDQGRDPLEMPLNHPGYDIESTALDGSRRIIEVKASSGRWGTRGVALTRTEFETAVARGDEYWLYVVESADSDSFWIHRIQDPARRANQFVFDKGWGLLGEGSE